VNATGETQGTVLRIRMVSAEQRRATWTVVKCASLDEMRANHIRAWQAVPPAERLKAAWELVVDAWEMKKRNPDELRFQRAVTVIRKA
jgi:hypothetical protein